MSDLVKQILEDTNSPFNKSDEEQLAKLPEDVLQRLVVGLQGSPSTTEQETDPDVLLNARKADLADCQSDIKELLKVEQGIRQDLATLGVQSVSVTDAFVKNVSSAPVELTEENVMQFVNTSKTITAMILREGLEARAVNRSKSIDVIVANSQVYSEEELKQKFTPELQKLAAFIQQTRIQTTPDITVYNWEGAGIADRTATMGKQQFCEPLQLPSTFQ